MPPKRVRSNVKLTNGIKKKSKKTKEVQDGKTIIRAFRVPEVPEPDSSKIKIYVAIPENAGTEREIFWAIERNHLIRCIPETDCADDYSIGWVDVPQQNGEHLFVYQEGNPEEHIELIAKFIHEMSEEEKLEKFDEWYENEIESERNDYEEVYPEDTDLNGFVETEFNCFIIKFDIF